jgi:penicillin amidase
MRSRILLTLLVVVLLLAAVAFGMGRWWVGRAFPQTSGTLQLAGLDGPVEVRRDEWGVPHLYATTLHDLYFAQGVVHAQDRLWQMDFQRRVGLGRLSELLGEPTIETDRFLRTIGTHRAAQQDYDALSDEAKAVLQAYADGVNAYASTHPVLPLEYQLLQAEWEPWQPVHTLAWAKMMQWDLSSNWSEELFRPRLVEQVGPERAALLLRDGTQVGAPLTHSIGEPDLAALEATLRCANLGSGSNAGRGSNAWVVSGQNTATGRPLLENDPHLGPGMPSIWYEIGLHAPGMDVVGASLPGAPAVIIGHNANIAWGVTTLPLDTQDLFIERLSEDGTRYEWQGEQLSLTTRQETIRVNGGEAVTFEVRESRHGPLLNDVVEGLEMPLAFYWRATAEPTHLFEAVLGLNHAADRDDFLAALEQWDSPPQNFVYADVSGTIGYVAAGELPIRPAAGGVLPQPGWTGEWEWQGTVPLGEMPQQWNPPEGYLVTANDNPFPEDFPYYTGTDWAAPYRATRIRQMIEASDALTPDDFQTMQRDVTSLPAPKLVPLLVALPTADIVVQRAQEQLSTWNFQLEGDLPGAGIYEVTYGFVVRHLLADELGDDLLESYLGYTQDHLLLVSELLDEPDHALWDDTRTPEQERRDDILLRALLDANEWLGRRFGSVPHEWFWNRLHTVTFDHPIGEVEPLDRIFNRTLEASGDRTTVNAIGFTYSEGYEANNVPSYRQIVDVGAWENSRMLHTTGQSGHPFHPHFDDMLDEWQHVELGPMYWTDEQTTNASQGRTLRLEPAP